ncbi:MAG: NirA family protein [Pseudomonadota bacterium]
MSHPSPSQSAEPAVIASSKRRGFTTEQKHYLADMLVKLNLHLALGGEQAGQQPAMPEQFWGTPVEDLCKEEKAKYETHVLDIWDQIVEHNDANKIAEGITQFMFRHYGVFNVEPNSPGYMCRMRIPACKLRGDQLAMLGDMSETVAGAYAHVTTRGNLQFREIMPDRVLDLFATLYDIGLSCKGTGADSARNITASPTAGFDPLELIDLHQYGIDLSHRILNTRDLHGLPRKFNIAFDNAGSISCVADTNDVGFIATQVLENDTGLQPGIYCRLLLGGITGHHDFAQDTGFVCHPKDTPLVAEAILRVFLAHGDRTNRKKARFKYVLDEHGVAWVCERIQEQLERIGNGRQLIPLPRRFDAPRPAINRQGHIGVHKQSQPGYNYIGVALKLGRLSAEQMRGLGAVAQKYGNNDVRLTVWQNLLIPHVADGDVDLAVSEIEALGLTVAATAFAAGAVACTGRMGCKLANAYTKQDAESIVDHLQARFELDQAINIHLTGCHNTCAQHYIGDIGMIGTTAADGSEGYNVFVGGGSDSDQGLARFLCGPIAARDVCALSEKIIANYLNIRRDKESFLAFTKRHDETQLQHILLAD